MIRSVAWFLSAFCFGVLVTERLGAPVCICVSLALLSGGMTAAVCPLPRIGRMAWLQQHGASRLISAMAFVATAGILLGTADYALTAGRQSRAAAELSSIAMYSGTTLVTGFVDGPVKESGKSFSMPFSISGSYGRSGFARWTGPVDIWLTVSKGSRAPRSPGARGFALYFYDRAKKIVPGDELALYIRVKRVPPGSFLNSLMRRGICWEASASIYGLNRLPGAGTGVFVWQGRLLGGIEKRVTDGLGAAMAGLILALSMGDRSLASGPVVSALASLGIVHAFVASGATIRMSIEPAVRIVQRRLSSWPEVWYVAGLAGTLFLLLLTGLAPPAFRASVAYIYELTAVYLNKKADRWTANALAATALTVWQSTLLTDPGVVLSFCSVATLQYLPGVLRSLPLLRRMGNWPRGIVTRGLSAEIGITPLVAVLYGQFNAASLAVNILLYPLLEWLLPASLLLLGIACLDPELCAASAPFLAQLAANVDNGLLWAAKQPMVFKFKPPSYVDVLIYYSAFVLAVETFKRYGLRRSRPYW